MLVARKADRNTSLRAKNFRRSTCHKICLKTITTAECLCDDKGLGWWTSLVPWFSLGYLKSPFVTRIARAINPAHFDATPFHLRFVLERINRQKSITRFQRERHAN
ncbi:hypothetical protein THTE_1468 [Thermogutta terrifontis]|uniref:Uncharacterized protein n=1 Tax=Thermogutta terrifontis TaxID=1331910 RepID=A0A286RDN4_9BACT|nr:hypothetical protein THTE_1468 [Thermogutta terrifontis]